MSADFRAYLDAKYPLDSRSLNRDVLENLKSAISAKRHLRWLDLGTGTGAMLKRVIDMNPVASLNITGLDIDAGLLAAAAEQLTDCLQQNGFQIEDAGGGISAYREKQTVRIRFECASILDWSPNDTGAGFDLITAHAFMDIVPLQPVTCKIREYLETKGLFYTTLNYDGETALIPVYSNEKFEGKILQHYDQSMETRQIEGLSTGGAYSGRRLIGALSMVGFDISSYGSSDWNITPVNTVYRDNDAFCLKSLLAMIYAEAAKEAAFNPNKLATWHSERSHEIDSSTLGMIVHQLDILAVKSCSGFV